MPAPKEPSGDDDKEDRDRKEKIREYQREYARRRLKDDPEFRERKKENNREYYKRRWASDPAFRERKRDANIRAQERRLVQERNVSGHRRGPTEIDAYIGGRIHKRRIDLGVPVSVLSDILEVRPRQIILYERGQSILTAGHLYMIAECLKISIDWFYIGLEENIGRNNQGN